MLDQNPLRIDFYERYWAIIDLYNQGKEYASVKEIFDKLKDYYKDLSAEERRAFAENLSQEELAVFDMLDRDKKINDNEKGDLKETAKQLLKQPTEKEFKVDRWAEKVQTASAVRKAINDYRFNGLPYPTYSETDIKEKTDVLFNFFKRQYGTYAAA